MSPANSPSALIVAAVVMLIKVAATASTIAPSVELLTVNVIGISPIALSAPAKVALRAKVIVVLPTASTIKSN